ncbi:MAG: flagellar basal body rod protein FlgB [Nitrospinae bacterium]|nr:flagellar basal body rod protein FlgB [Nitrospinota bacterium]
MKIFGLTTSKLELASKSLDFLTNSAVSTSVNIANVATPGYKAVESKDFKMALADSLNDLAGKGITRTNVRHFSTSTAYNLQPIKVSSEEGSLKLDGNNVNMDEELLRQSETRTEYSKYSSMAGNEIAAMRRAISLSAL